MEVCRNKVKYKMYECLFVHHAPCINNEKCTLIAIMKVYSLEPRAGNLKGLLRVKQLFVKRCFKDDVKNIQMQTFPTVQN